MIDLNGVYIEIKNAHRNILYFQQRVPNNKYKKNPHSLSFQGKVTHKALA